MAPYFPARDGHPSMFPPEDIHPAAHPRPAERQAKPEISEAQPNAPPVGHIVNAILGAPPAIRTGKLTFARPATAEDENALSCRLPGQLDTLPYIGNGRGTV
jgi:hypothetical protein